MNKLSKHYHNCIRCISLLSIMLFTAYPVYASDEYVQQPETDDLGAGTLYLKSTAGYLDAPILDSALSVSVSGVVSKIILTQTFENNSTDWVEGLYVFPLPDQAAVNAMIIRIGDREIVGSVHEKKQAEKQYEIAKQAGKVASLVKQHRPNLFSTRFANVPPGESIAIELSYVQTVRYENDRYSLRVPLTITPRYTNTNVSDAAAITPPQVHLGDAMASDSLSHSVDIEATLFGNFLANHVKSPSHQLSISPGDDSLQLAVTELAHLDRDFILEWYEFVDDEPSIQAWRQSVAGEEYLLATVMPPQDDSQIPVQPRELVLVIDTSGSMAGASIEAAKAALLDALANLQPADYFNIIEFNSDYRALFDSPQPASQQNIDSAARFTNRLYADGGTEMMGAMHTALGYNHTGLLRQVVFITDGSVGYEESVLDSVKQDLGPSRLFTVGIGSAPNQWFMRKVAEAGRGTYHFITDVSGVHSEMSRLLEKLDSPALTDISVSLNTGSAELVPDPIPDLYADEPVIIAARLIDNPQTIRVSGQWGNQLWETTVDIANAPSTQSGLSTVWARKKIEALEDKQRFHSDPDYYRSLILKTALDHQILSRYTAFLAIDTTPVRETTDALANKQIPNLMPDGSTMQAIAFPQGASGIDTFILIGLLACILALLSIYFRLFNKEQVLS